MPQIWLKKQLYEEIIKKGKNVKSFVNHAVENALAEIDDEGNLELEFLKQRINNPRSSVSARDFALLFKKVYDLEQGDTLQKQEVKNVIRATRGTTEGTVEKWMNTLTESRYFSLGGINLIRFEGVA